MLRIFSLLSIATALMLVLASAGVYWMASSVISHAKKDSAEAIAKVTGIHFTDSGYKGGYTINNQGIPNIVMDARKWWNNKGQYQKLD